MLEKPKPSEHAMISKWLKEAVDRGPGFIDTVQTLSWSGK